MSPAPGRPLVLLLLALAVLATGCGGGGNDPYNPVAVPTNGVAALRPQVTINKTTLGAALRTALDTAGAQLTLRLADGSTVTMTVANETAGQIVFTTSAAIAVGRFTVSGGSYLLPFTATITGVTVPLTVTVPTGLAVTSSGESSTSVSATVALATDVNGRVTYTYTVTYVPAGTSVATTSATLSPPGGLTPTTLPALYVEKMTAMAGSTETVLGAAEVSGVSATQPVFKATFNRAVAAVPTTCSVTLRLASQSFTWSLANSQLTAALDTSRRVLTLTAAPGGSTAPASGTSYEVVFASSDLTADGATVTATLPANVTYRIRTASGGGGSPITNPLTLTRAAWLYGSSSELDLSTATAVNNVPFSGASFKLVFNQAIAAVPPLAVEARVGASTLTIPAASLSVALGSDLRSLVVTLGSGVQLQSASSYQLSFVASVTAADNASNVLRLDDTTRYLLTTRRVTLSAWDFQVADGTAPGGWRSVRSGNTVLCNPGGTTRVLLTFDAAVTLPYDLGTSDVYQFSAQKTNTGTTVTGPVRDWFYDFQQPAFTQIAMRFAPGKALTPGDYFISWSNGAITDAGGQEIDSSPAVTFSAQ